MAAHEQSGPPILVERHAPEHGDSPSVLPAPAGCCCCCCCCCLHTIGGVAGAIHGAVSHIDQPHPYRNYDRDRDYDRERDREARRYWDRDRNTDDDIDAPHPFPFRRDQFEEEQPLFSVALLYWLVVLFLAALVAVGTYLAEGATNPGLIVVGGFIAVMVLPGLQLVASLITFILVLICYADKSQPLTRIGRITLWSFVGSLLGVLAMAGCFGVLIVAGNLR